MTLPYYIKSIFTNLTKFLLIILIISSCKKADFVPLQKNNDVSFFYKADSTISVEVKRVIDAMKSRNDAELIASNIQQSNGVPLWSHAKISKSEDFQTKANNNSFNMNGDTIVIIPLMIPNSNFINGFIRAKLNGEVTLDLFRGADYDLYHTNTDSINPDKAALQIIWLNTEIFSTTKYKIPDLSLFKINGITYSGNQERVLTVNSIVDLASSGKFATVEICTTMPSSSGCSCGHHDLNQCECVIPNCCWVTSCQEIYMGGGGGGGGTDGGGGSAPLPDPNGGGGGSGGDPFPCASIQDKAVPLPGCDPPGPGPVILVPASAVIVYLTNQLQLNIQEINWLIGHQAEANFLYENLNEDQVLQDDILLTDPDAILSAKLILKLMLSDVLSGPYNNSNFLNIIRNALPQQIISPNFDILYITYLRITCALLKFENPTWDITRILYEANKEILHSGLDLAGLVPVIGEVADLINGNIYIIEGDGYNATLSLISSIPIYGWSAQGFKYVKRAINIYGANGTLVGTTSLKWIKNSDGSISFGSSKQLKRILNLGVGTGLQAHHILPIQLANHDLIQKAASGGANAFHINEFLNGIPLGPLQHMGSHDIYTATVRIELQRLWDTNGGYLMSTTTAESLIRSLETRIRNWILANPSSSINYLTL